MKQSNTTTTKPTKFRRVSKKVEAGTIEYLERLIAEAKAGELVGCTFISELAGGFYRINHVGATSSRTQMAAMLISAAIERLGFKNDCNE